IRTLIQGMQLHANAHRGYMPLVGLVPSPPGGASNIQVADPKLQKYEYFTNGGTPNDALGMPGSVCKFLGYDLDTSSATSVQTGLNTGIIARLMLCPSDKEAGQFGQTVNDVPPSKSSYAYNEAALGWGESTDNSGVTPGH